MTLYYVSIGTKEYKIEISQLTSKINGKTIQAALVQLGEQGLYLLKKNTFKREMLIKTLENGQYSLNVSGKHALVKVEKSNHNVQRNTSQPAENEMKAPISGIVIKVNVEVGDHVEKDAVILVLESMKMQMMMRSPIAGKVISVDITPGAHLSKGDPMVKIE